MGLIQKEGCKMQIKIRLGLGIIGLISLSVILGFTEDQVLTEDELQALLAGKMVKGIYIDNKNAFIRQYSEDGRVRENMDNIKQDGKWFIDKKGQHCVIWSGKEKKCRVLVKDGETYKEFTIQKNGKPKLNVIYKKIWETNPDGM